jgi:hypothetical protein
MKPVGKPDAGNPHVRFDERGEETDLRQWRNNRASPRLYSWRPKGWRYADDAFASRAATVAIGKVHRGERV